MLTYVWRQELIPLLSLDPVLHYYPLMACYQEPRAPVTVWKDGEGIVQGALVPCDPPGRAWIVASANEVIAALMEEVPSDTAISLPLWADSVVRAAAPGRSLSSEGIAVCTEASLRIPPPQPGFTLGLLDGDPDGHDAVVTTAPAQVGHVGCVVEGTLAGFCTYWTDGRGSGSIERLVITEGWLGADVGKSILAAAATTILQEGERVIFQAAAENQSVLGAARQVGFRTCYWLRTASAE